MKKVIKGKKRFTKIETLVREEGDDLETIFHEGFKHLAHGHVKDNG